MSVNSLLHGRPSCMALSPEPPASRLAAPAWRGVWGKNTRQLRASVPCTPTLACMAVLWSPAYREFQCCSGPWAAWLHGACGAGWSRLTLAAHSARHASAAAAGDGGACLCRVCCGVCLGMHGHDLCRWHFRQGLHASRITHHAACRLDTATAQTLAPSTQPCQNAHEAVHFEESKL